MNNLDQKNNQQLEKAIVSAVAYFDIFDFPLTFFEIWQNLYFEKEGCQKFSLTDVSGKLNELIKQNVVEKKDGFYFFSGRAEIIKTRLDRYKLAEKKYHLALKIAKIFSFIPFVKLTAICNSLAYANSRRGSDIDFFIVTREKRI